MRKVLIITYYWPPSGGPGVQRVLKFVKYLPQFGWQPIVLTVESGNYPSIDETLLNEIPDSCKVYKTKSFEPFELYKSFTGKSDKEKIPTFVLNKNSKESITEKISRWLRANVFVPDAKIGWVNYIVKEGLKIVETEKPDVILSSSPPHSLQIGAMKLASKTGIKWVADFRDPWSDAFWQKDIKRLPFASRKDKRYEKQVLSKADYIITVSKTIASQFKQKAGSRFKVIPNGYDEVDFEFTAHRNNKFVINYTGTLGESQKVTNFIEAVSLLEGKVKENIEINFYGTFHSSIHTLLENSGLVNVYNEVSHTEVTKIMRAADMLLLVIPDVPNNGGILTGKLFEYIASGNFILGIGPKDGDASEILETSGSGKMYDYKENLSEVILKHFNLWLSENSQSVDKDKISKFSRRNLTEKLTQVFGQLL